MKSVFSAFAIALFVLTQSPIVRADETMGEKVDAKAGDAKTHMKKNARHAKRKMRKATGHNTVGDDISDGAKDVGDDVSNGAKKAKNKVD